MRELLKKATGSTAWCRIFRCVFSNPWEDAAVRARMMQFLQALRGRLGLHQRKWEPRLWTRVRIIRVTLAFLHAQNQNI